MIVITSTCCCMEREETIRRHWGRHGESEHIIGFHGTHLHLVHLQSAELYSTLSPSRINGLLVENMAEWIWCRTHTSRSQGLVQGNEMQSWPKAALLNFPYYYWYHVIQYNLLHTYAAFVFLHSSTNRLIDCCDLPIPWACKTTQSWTS